ncbi:rhamnosyltransferase [Nitrosomonas sp. Nm166]|nr:rhamnosyltransferase [Nitrosomonas sp. Nm166]
MPSSSICAVIVTYDPDLSALANLLSALTKQVAITVIVDNGSSKDCVAWIEAHQQENVISLLLAENLGVAEAHNHAIRWAQENEMTHVVLFDQDSLPFPNMIRQLLASEIKLLQRGEQVAAVGPQYHDPRHPRPAPFFQFSGLKSIRTYCKDGENEPHQADFLITSGMLIRLSVLNAVGLMDASLFIDYVDIEWCLRVKHMKYKCFGVCTAKMSHTLGDRVVSWQNGRRIIPVHSPLRNYYLIRNAILLYKRNYISTSWALSDAYRLLLKYGLFSLLIPPRFLNFKMMTIGLWHGIRGVSGKFPGHWQHHHWNHKPESNQ